MNKTIVIIIAVALGIYCLPTILAIIGSVFAVLIGLVAAVFAIGLTAFVTLAPLLIFVWLVWWLVRDKRKPQQY
ncbi:hypothetical protein SAMN06297280_2701 [Arsukibacterium tuosuense]|uniref:Phage shock protein G n=1 Tax=Arsukibacterium tuosuense TaxID=1323745 RepID=A0A285J307_9GAMM|nr:hypothetical protein [Arsukibacterium tuosuense]SNY54654.1 hypothetical protein SAMN06297280_2701 [Arsukibacterium tuosuense]